MIDIEKGRYWDLPWSLVDGCTPCSPGCDHCWSAALSHRFRKKMFKETGEHLVGCGGFRGVVVTRPERFSIPLKRNKPVVYAVWNDLFHDAVSDQFLYEATRVMRHSFAAQHTFLILTKRPRRMRLQANLYDELPNVWSGLTVCNQQEADAKIPIFLHVQGKKFLSIEPMLGPLDLRIAAFNGADSLSAMAGIDAVILGGETGPGARPMHPDWVRFVRDQCQVAKVPFFLKHMNKKDGRMLDGMEWNNLPWL